MRFNAVHLRHDAGERTLNTEKREGLIMRSAQAEIEQIEYTEGYYCLSDRVGDDCCDRL